MKTFNLIRTAAAVAFVAAGMSAAVLWTHDSLAQGLPGPAAHGIPHDGRHLAMMADHINAAANSTPEQKARIDALVAQAGNDLQALHAQAVQDHAQLHAILLADSIDRAALENMRAAHIRAADQGSRILTRLLADVAEVLTPDQRKAVISRMQQMHGAH
jgi:protein CpxP